jgi:geranylgeranyl diphosphate synthase, type II
MRHTSAIESAIEAALTAALDEAAAPGAPARLVAALRHAVFPGGARVRPRLTLSVAMVCGDRLSPLACAAAAAVELIHCASLVHDDMPCFDDAPMRRGRVSVHAAFGERCALLAGDALIVLAFQTLGAGAMASGRPERLPAMLALLASHSGMPLGIVAGQGWECEDWVQLPDYHRAKTASLFACASQLGAIAAGAEARPWKALGDWLGEAYQAADDLRDVAGDTGSLGKPTGRDKVLGRPNLVNEMGLAGALDHFEQLVDRAASSVPEVKQAPVLRALLRTEAERLVPAELRQRVGAGRHAAVA